MARRPLKNAGLVRPGREELLLNLLAMIAGFLATVLFYAAVFAFLWLVFSIDVPLDPWERLGVLFAIFFPRSSFTPPSLLIAPIFIGMTVYSIGIDPLGPIMGPITSLF